MVDQEFRAEFAPDEAKAAEHNGDIRSKLGANSAGKIPRFLSDIR